MNETSWTSWNGCSNRFLLQWKPPTQLFFFKIFRSLPISDTSWTFWKSWSHIFWVFGWESWHPSQKRLFRFSFHWFIAVRSWTSWKKKSSTAALIFVESHHITNCFFVVLLFFCCFTVLFMDTPWTSLLKEVPKQMFVSIDTNYRLYCSFLVLLLSVCVLEEQRLADRVSRTNARWLYIATTITLYCPNLEYTASHFSETATLTVAFRKVSREKTKLNLRFEVIPTRSIIRLPVISCCCLATPGMVVLFFYILS